MDYDGDVIAMPGERLVDRVVNNLVDEVVQPSRPGGADVHPRPSADSFEPLQDGDVLGVITRLFFRAPSGAAVICQRSSDDIETPRNRASDGAPGRQKQVHIRIAQRTPELAPQPQ